MQKVEVKPRSREWHDIRNASMTASTAAVFFVPENLRMLKECAEKKYGTHLDIEPLVAFGIESFFNHTPWTLWAEKMGRIPRFQGNEATARGVRNEDRIISLLESAQDILLDPEVTATCDGKDSWILASFDALAPADSDPTVVAPNGFPVEAKCPAFASRKKLWDSRKAGNLGIMGLPYYWCQVQHQIMVADAPYGWFVAAGVEKDPATGTDKVVFPLIDKVPRDDRVLAAYRAVIQFYYTTFLEPMEEPPMLESDRKLLAELTRKAEFDRALMDGGLDIAIDMYLDLVRKEKELESQRKELEKKVIATAEKLRTDASNVIRLADRLEVTFAESHGAVSWQKVAKALAKSTGLPDVPGELLAAHTGAPKQTVKLKEV